MTRWIEVFLIKCFKGSILVPSGEIGWRLIFVVELYMLILVSGSPTQEISIKRRLKQRDPLTPFLFLIFVKGLVGWNASRLKLFKRFEVGIEGLFISHLQYEDDILCLGEAAVENFLTLKAILRCLRGWRWIIEKVDWYELMFQWVLWQWVNI